MKNIVIAGAVLIVVLTLLYFFIDNDKTEDSTTTTGDEVTQDTNADRIMNPQDEIEHGTPAPSGKLKADTFTGTLEEVNTGCFVDGECYVVVDGKHVTVLTGERLGAPREVGSVQGVEDGIGGLEAHIGGEVEVYAQDNSDGTYTLYGSEGFYVKALK
jgi:hypothetical protein